MQNENGEGKIIFTMGWSNGLFGASKAHIYIGPDGITMRTAVALHIIYSIKRPLQYVSIFTGRIIIFNFKYIQSKSISFYFFSHTASRKAYLHILCL